MARFLPLLLVMQILCAPFAAWAQIDWPGAMQSDTTESAQRAPAQVQTSPPLEYGSLGEVIPRLSQLQDDQERALLRIATLEEIDRLRRRLQTAREQQGKILGKGTELGDFSGLSAYQVDELRGRLAEQKDLLRRTLGTLSERIQDLELLRAVWLEKGAYWNQWKAALQEKGFQVPGEAFGRAEELTDRVLEDASAAIADLVALQHEVTAMSEEVRQLVERSAGALQRGTFRRTAKTFLDPEFYRQFNASLWEEVRRSAFSVEGVDRRFLREQGWLLLVQLLLLLAMAQVLLRYRRRNEVTDEWNFILRHPWHTGLFVASASLSPFYLHPPDLWVFGLSVAVAVSASVLIGALLEHGKKAMMAYILAGLFVFSLALQTISLPQPLYRLYLVLVSLAGVPLLLVVAKSLKAETDGNRGFVLLLRGGAAILLVSLVAQVGGYNVFSFRLIESSVKTVFLVLVAAMAVKLGLGAIDFLLSREYLRRWRFFRRFGRELDRRLSRVLRTLVVLYVGFYLLEIWGVYESMGRAWSEILDIGFTLGEIDVTVEMLLLAAVALYAASAASWVIRSVLEAEVFPRRQFDRGIRDAIKKILNYCIIVVGVILALAITGVELQNFTVLAGAFGIGIGFGMQNIVNNFVSGLILLFERPIKVGDLLIVDDEWGTVRKIGLRSTVVTTLDESEIIVPNSILISEKVTNWSLSSPLCRISVPVGVAYGSDVPLVLRILQEASEHVEKVLDDPPPSPLFSGFGDSSLDFDLRVWISDVRDRLRVRSELCQYVDRRFREEGVEIPFPQRDLHLRTVADKVVGKVMDSKGSVGAEQVEEEGSEVRRGGRRDVEARRFAGDEDRAGEEGDGEDGDGD